MTINSYFYDSVNSDRPYSAGDFAKAFGIILSDGVIAKDDTGALGLDIGGTNYNTIFSGRATIQGHFCEVATGTTQVLTVPTGSYSGSIVFRVDITGTRAASIIVRTDQNPQQDASAWELLLYYCTVTNGVITAVTDKRVQGGAVAKPASNVPTYTYKENGVYLNIGTYTIALTPAQPSTAAKKVWIQVDN
jgi:hypothetical protein